MKKYPCRFQDQEFNELTITPSEFSRESEDELLREQYQEYLISQEDEIGELARALATSLETDQVSAEQEIANLSNQELERYLLEKRLDLKKYFVFNIQELTTKKLCDDFKNVAYNGRAIKESLAEDLTKLAIAHG
ncbi:16490_t:CDS:2 [Entrophospora sp. SA101]|nr:5648_t:CDS:2 [Entrophospora sp. SA101]CAJ0761240.1 16490_t:CDS:2 [Entrophospora sp. SA101]CAJ0845807.1 4343_t:CDS:2 [Entrophospora sp. SA101]CAJ0912267.1 9068_t:CDS:2 [Entrophospora sp. SA101]